MFLCNDSGNLSSSQWQWCYSVWSIKTLDTPLCYQGRVCLEDSWVNSFSSKYTTSPGLLGIRKRKRLGPTKRTVRNKAGVAGKETTCHKLCCQTRTLTQTPGAQLRLGGARFEMVGPAGRCRGNTFQKTLMFNKFAAAHLQRCPASRSVSLENHVNTGKKI